MMKRFNPADDFIHYEIRERLRNTHLTLQYDFFNSIKYAKGIIYLSKKIGLGRWWIVSELFCLGEKSKPLYSKEIDYKYCMSDAERADVDGDYFKAITLYTKSADEGQMDLDDYLNLIHLLWRCTVEPPLISRTSKQPITLDYDANERMESMLKRCSQEYPGCSDVDFWEEYYRVSGNWKAHTEEEWLSIINKYDHYFPYSYQMYFVCYLYNKEKYTSHMSDFLVECDRYPTALNLYIKEQIERAE